jgi:nicotinate dehydrogenase subunit B
MSLPAALGLNPLISTWIRFVDGQVIVHTGKVELGQGISTAIAVIAAEELDVDLDQVSVITGRTDMGPNEFITAGSMSIEGSGAAMRCAAAEARMVLVQRAAQRFDIDPARLKVERGIVANESGNEQVSYWQLLGQEQLDIEITGTAAAKQPIEYRYVGRFAQRVDLREKIYGGMPYIQDMESANSGTVPLHGRIIRPPVLTWRLAQIDTRRVVAMEGVVAVVVDGSFVGVIARQESVAINARDILYRAVTWDRGTYPPQPADTTTFLLEQPHVTRLVEQGTPTESPVPDILFDSSGTRVQATYSKPYHLHGSIGTSSALAQFNEGCLTVYSHAQGPAILRGALAQALELNVDDVTVIHRENAGCYGHNGADDAAMDAAMLAIKCPGNPVLVKWHREDEHRWEPFSPAMVMSLDATLIDNKVACWNADIVSQTHSGRPSPMGSDYSNLIAAWHKSQPLTRPKARPGMGNHSGIHRNADPYYIFDTKRITKNLVTDARIRTSSTRGLGAFANVFAIESFMDELATNASCNPTQFRIDHLDDPRAIAVLQTASDHLAAIGWDEQPGLLHGRGIAFARYKNAKTYAAVGVLLTVDEETLDIRLRNAVIAADAGQIIDSDGLANQLEGGFIQASSWTLKEQVLFDAEGIPGADWDSYPILTFPEIPEVEVLLLDQPDEPSLGAGEATQGPTPAAISNAIYDATGLRLRDIPFLPETLKRTALKK